MVAAQSKATAVLNLSIGKGIQKKFNWYDFSLKIKGFGAFEERFARHVEDGSVSKTDPLMGGVVLRVIGSMRKPSQ